MKSNQSIKTIDLTLKFTFLVFIIIFLSGIIVSGFLFFLIHVGIVSLEDKNHWLIIFLFFLASLILGTIIAVIVSRKSLAKMNEILNVISQIGQGNFDVHLEINDNLPEGIEKFYKNINQMASDLKNLEILRKDFISDFSHEFKTPIVSIHGFAKRLLTKDLSEEKRQEYLEIIVEESTRLSELSTNTLLMSSLDGMNHVKNKAYFPLDEQIRQCVSVLEKQLLDKQIDLIMNMPKIIYNGNEEILKQVWLNLLSNAIKFSKTNGNIMIGGSIHENGVVLSFSDDGIGMNDETTLRVFDKFYQGDASRTTQGNGLGLSIVKRIIDACGGEILVKSAINEGSTFTVVLPIKE